MSSSPAGGSHFRGQIMRKPTGYNFSMEANTSYGRQAINLSCWPSGDIWLVRMSGPQLQLQMELPDFEDLVLMHLRHQKYTIWTPDEKTAAYAMAHMVGALNDDDSWRGLK